MNVRVCAMSVFSVSVGTDAQGCVSMAMMAAGWLCVCVCAYERQREGGWHCH